MKLTFIGAAHEVTGSCHFLQVAGKNILVDCGMEQGPDLYENPGLPIPENEVDYVLLIVHIFRNSKQNGAIVREDVQVNRYTSRYTQWKMRSMQLIY